MKTRKVVAWENLPTRLPLMPTLVAWLCLDRTVAPGWVYGLVGGFLLLMWIGAVVALVTERRTSIFED